VNRRAKTMIPTEIAATRIDTCMNVFPQKPTPACSDVGSAAGGRPTLHFGEPCQLT
jgi:hypothetical protein